MGAQEVDMGVGETPQLVIASVLRQNGTTGVHTHLRELQAFLNEANIASTTVTPFSWNRVLSTPVFGVRLALERFSGSASVAWYRYFHESFLRRALHKRLRSLDQAVIYAQGPVEARAALLARKGRQQRVIMAIHFQTSQADEWARKGVIRVNGMVYRSIREFERNVIPMIDGIVFVSHGARLDLLSWLPEADAVPSAVIPNFLGPGSTHPEGEIRDLVSVGSLEIAKNHRFLLHVLHEARLMGSLLTLDLFGEGRCRRDLERLASSLDLTQQVRFHGFRPDVRRLLPAYRVYVHASYSEALPYAILEAMAAGLPIIAGRAGVSPELFQDGVQGRLWPLDDPQQAATVLLKFLSDKPRLAAAGAASLVRYKTCFQSEVVGPELYSFLTKPIAQSPRPSMGSLPMGMNSQKSETFYPVHQLEAHTATE